MSIQVLFKCSHSSSFIADICFYIVATKTVWPTKLKYLLSGPWQKMFADPRFGAQKGPCAWLIQVCQVCIPEKLGPGSLQRVPQLFILPGGC